MRRRIRVIGGGLMMWVGLTANAPGIVAHPVHLSSTQVEVAPDRKSLVITVRVFTDDLERALAEAGRPAVHLATSAPAAIDTLLATYFATRLRVSVDDAPLVSGRLTGHANDGEAILVHLGVPVRVVPRHLAIEQRVLLELYEDQNNVVRVIIGATTRTVLLRRGMERASFTF